MRLSTTLALVVLTGIAAAGMQEIIPAQTVAIGYQKIAGQIAVTRGEYDPDDPGGDPDIFNLVAVATGNNSVKLMIFNPENPSLTYSQDIVVGADLHPFNIRFMNLQLDGIQDLEHCLVIPCYGSVLSDGSIYIYDLENRVLYDDCLNWNGTETTREVYSVARVLESGVGSEDIYAISIDSQIRLAHLVIENGPFFNIIDALVFDEVYYASMSMAIPPRAFETFSTYEINGEHFALTSCHNGGVLLWKVHGAGSPMQIAWIRVGQWGGSGSHYGQPTMVDGELGDMHRGAVLHGNDQYPSLLFSSNHTMGMMVYDIYPGDDDKTPDFVWQWDNDSRLTHYEGIELVWDWHGSGDGSTVAPGNEGIPGCTFGIGLNTDSETNLIHVFLAGGADGLREFDFSRFFSPFGVFDPNNMFKAFDITCQAIYRNAVTGENYLAYDLRTLDIPGYDRFVVTSWKESIAEMQGEVLVSVHLDGAGPGDYGSTSSSTGVNTLSMTLGGSNPASSSVSFQITCSCRTADLSIHDMAGRLILREQLMINDGSTSWTWDGNTESGSPAPSGVYLYRLVDSQGGSVSTRSTLFR